MGIVSRAAPFQTIESVPETEIAVAVSALWSSLSHRPSRCSNAQTSPLTDPGTQQTWRLSTMASFVRAALRKVQVSIESADASIDVGKRDVTRCQDRCLPRLGQRQRRRHHVQAHRQDAHAVRHRRHGHRGAEPPSPITKTVASAVSGVSGAAAHMVSATSHHQALGQRKYDDDDHVGSEIQGFCAWNLDPETEAQRKERTTSVP